MSEAAEVTNEHWRELLLASGNQGWLQKALSSFPPTVLVQVFKAHFRPHSPEAIILTGKKLNRVAAEDVLENLEKIRERRLDILEGLLGFWIDHVAADIIKQEGVTDTAPDALSVIAWLWSNTPEAPAPEWHTVQTLATMWIPLVYSGGHVQHPFEGCKARHSPWFLG